MFNYLQKSHSPLEEEKTIFPHFLHPYLFNRPGVARAVLQSPLLLIKLLNNSLSSLFKASALWADALYKSICPSVRLYVCVSVCLSDVQYFYRFGILGEK